MAYSVTKNTISLTRGDTFIGKVDIMRNGESYTPEQDDIVQFSLKRNRMDAANAKYLDDNPLITKTIPNDTLVLRIDADDTKALEFGSYTYDINITFEDGTVDTFITAAPFILTPEVHSTVPVVTT